MHHLLWVFLLFFFFLVVGWLGFLLLLLKNNLSFLNASLEIQKLLRRGTLQHTGMDFCSKANSAAEFCCLLWLKSLGGVEIVEDTFLFCRNEAFSM